MIYTVTFNPAIDYIMKLPELKTGEINRSFKEEIFFGGKGINVSLVLNELGLKSKALGFAAGFTGGAIENGVRAHGIETDFVHLANGCSRINVKLKADLETEINGQGPEISKNDIEKLFEKLEALTDGDILILAGSVPNTLPSDIYERILKKLSGKGVIFIADASGKLLTNILKYRPFLIKPNKQELSEIFNTCIADRRDIIKYAKELQNKGAANVLVSADEKGSVLLDENRNVHIMAAPVGKAVNSVGAGDSMVAGFIAGYLEKNDYKYALQLGTASGSATAFSMGLAQRDEIYSLLSVLQKEETKLYTAFSAD